MKASRDYVVAASPIALSLLSPCPDTESERNTGIQLCQKDIQPRRSVPGFNEASKEGEWEHVLFLHFPYQLWTDVKYVCTFKISCHNVIHRRVDLVFPMSPARRLGP